MKYNYDNYTYANLVRAIAQPTFDEAQVFFLESLTTHLHAVIEAGIKLEISPLQLEYHDMSKFSPEEFPHYASYFHGGNKDFYRKDFVRAWLHHIHNNPHHWEYWVFSAGYNPGANCGIVDDCIEMPEKYVREMVADWMGASMAYTSSWDMSDWLTKNLLKVRLHPFTRECLYAILDIELGYDVHVDLFANVCKVALRK